MAVRSNNDRSNVAQISFHFTTKRNKSHPAPDEHFSHRPMCEPIEGRLELLEWKDMVDDRARTRLVQEFQRRFPGLTALLIRIGADGNATDSEASEEQGR